MKSTRRQSQSCNEFRCQKCHALLGVFEADAISIQRVDLQIAVEGKVSMTCYRCGKLNVAVHPKQASAQIVVEAALR